MRVRAHLKHAESGLEGTFDHDSDSMHNAEFMWQEGNFSCDCNRRMFLGLEPGECSDGDVLLVKLEQLEDE